MEEKRTVQSIARAMRVLEVLNRVGVVQVEQLHRDTKLPKSTLIRILETLTECGYVFQVSRKAGYALTEKALRPSAGVRDRDTPASVALPFP
jgi:IclR family transcriptional regulator, mhp operon transcriptional activator